MQQHPDIGKRDIQEITDFLQLQALAFAQGQHAALQFGQTVEGLVQAIAQFALGRALVATGLQQVSLGQLDLQRPYAAEAVDE